MAQTVSVQVIASNAKARTHNYYFGDAATLTEIQTSMNRHLVDLDAAIDGAIVGASLVTPLTVPVTVKDTPNAGANHDNAVRYVFNTAGGFTTTKTLTTVPESAINHNVDPRVPTSAELATWSTNVVANPDAGTTPTTDYRGDDINLEKSARAF